MKFSKTFFIAFFIALLTTGIITLSLISFFSYNAVKAEIGIEIETINEEMLSLIRAGKYDSALSLAEESYSLTRRCCGSEHPDTVSSLSALDFLYEARGYSARSAKPLFIEKNLEEEHPDTAYILNNLAELYRAQAVAITKKRRSLFSDHYHPSDSAVWIHKRALRIREKVLGEHPDTATSLNNLALVYESQGNDVDARFLHRRALSIREKVLGKEHPDTATSLNNLASAYSPLFGGDKEIAKRLYRRSLSIREKVLGKEHPDTATSLAGLAGVHESQEDYETAKLLYQRALSIREKVLGKEHPDTATSLVGLAEVHESQEDCETARLLYQRALSIREKVLSKEHPDTEWIRGILSSTHLHFC